MAADLPLHRFGPAFVTGQRERYGSRPPEGRPLSYDIAVEDEYAPWRDWYDLQLSHLGQRQAEEFANKMWFDQNFWSDTIELAAADALRATGLGVEYERAWGNLTPDWTVVGEDGEPLALVEVLTDSPSKATYGQMKAWHHLVERIKLIPVPVVLALAGDNGRPLDPPDARTAKRIAQDLRRYLLSPLQQSILRSEGYTFLMQADRRTGQAMRPPGMMRAILIPPSSRAGLVSARALVQRMDEKVSKYRALAREAGLPLILAAGAHRFTGLVVDQFDHLLTGQHAITMQFNYGDTHIPPVDIQLDKPDRWSMPPDLAGVLWVDNTFPFTTSWRPNRSAERSAPERLTRPWTR